MNAMMQMYMKLMNHPETKDIISDPTFMPILQSIMTNPTEAFKYMQDPRVQKIFKVLQENTSPEDLEKAAKNFKSKQAGAQPEEKAESNYTPPPPPPKKEEPKPEKMDV